MRGRGVVMSAVVCLAALLAASCTSRDTGGSEEDAAPSAAADFMDEVERLCAPVADEYAGFEDARDEERAGAAEDLARAEQDLTEGLRNLDVPDEAREGIDAYVEALEEYGEAEAAAGEGDDVERMKSVVAAAKADVRLDEAATEARLPDECPPPSSVDVDNNLFVAKVNLECLRFFEDAGGEPLKPPRSAREVALELDIARRITAGIAGAIRKAASPGVRGIPVKRLIRSSKKRFDAIDALAATFDSGDFHAYRKAAKRLTKTSREVDRKMVSYGLVLCAKAFSVVPL